ncbi:MAG: hypothetical protein JWM05_1129 [Acidimicrobiales bacterium]|nr:hypothetical protein [Acidimicrobiales bacterium]
MGRRTTLVLLVLASLGAGGCGASGGGNAIVTQPATIPLSTGAPGSTAATVTTRRTSTTKPSSQPAPGATTTVPVTLGPGPGGLAAGVKAACAAVDAYLEVVRTDPTNRQARANAAEKAVNLATPLADRAKELTSAQRTTLLACIRKMPKGGL